MSVSFLPGWLKRCVCLMSVVALLFVAAGCAQLSMPDSGGVNGKNASRQDNKSEEMQDEPFGSYLAAQHAQANRDIAAAANYFQEALKEDPENIVLLKRTFPLLVSNGQMKEAIALAARLETLGVEDNLARLVLVLNDIKDVKYNLARERLARIGDVGLYGLLQPFLLGWMLADEGSYPEVKAVLAAPLEEKVFMSFRRYHAALLFDVAAFTTLAEENYSLALSEKGQVGIRAVEAFGDFLTRQGKYKEARQLYQNYLDIVPDNAVLQAAMEKVRHAEATHGRQLDNPPQFFATNAQQGIGELFHSVALALMQDKVRGTAVLYLQIAKYMRPDLTASQMLLGQAFELSDYPEGALSVYLSLMDDPVYGLQSRLRIAWVLEQQGREEEAIAAFRALHKDYPDRQDVLTGLGDLYRGQKKYEAAVAAYSNAIDLISSPQESSWGLFYTRGISYERLGQWPLAEADLLQALSLRPEQPHVMNYLAYSWIEQGQNFEEARNMLYRAVALRPNDGYIVDSLGWALFKLGEMSQAVEVLEKAVLLQPDDWTINDHLGDAYWAVGRQAEARFQWRHAISLDPEDADRQKLIDKIENGYR
ncbi:MAG: hypothetical protein CMF31_03800 [Kordiimonas sp.]|nr:hypothetical protein [Kordiimonas sp.]